MPRALRLVTVLVALTFAGCSSDRTTSTTSSPTSSPTSTSTTGARIAYLEGARFRLTPIARLDAPTAFAVRRGDTALYVTEQVGRVRAVRGGKLDPRPVLDLTSIVGSGGERGLLGLAFSPDGTRLYVDYTNRDGNTRVDEYAMRVDGTAPRASRRELLAIAQPQANHNGGSVVVGPDGMLYVGMGDGGGAGDQGEGHAPQGNGQSLETLLGKILRIDPTPASGVTAGGRPEIWALGLRNPWKFSFDRTTGDLLIADVGQYAWEEIDWVPAGSKKSARNFGWPLLEGTHRFRSGDASGTIPPVLEYSHDDGRCAISGGYVYRGAKIPDLVGAYVYSDSCDGKIRATLVGRGVRSHEVSFGVGARAVVGFGEDHDGELYVLSQGQGLLRMDPA